MLQTLPFIDKMYSNELEWSDYSPTLKQFIFMCLTEYLLPS